MYTCIQNKVNPAWKKVSKDMRSNCFNNILTALNITDSLHIIFAILEVLNTDLANFYKTNFGAAAFNSIFLLLQITRKILEVLRVDFGRVYNYFLPHSFFPYFHYPAYR